MVLFYFLFAVKWQALYMPVTDSVYSMKMLLEMPVNRLRFVGKDSIQIAAYEIQVLVFDKRGDQVAGDFWLKEIEDNEAAICDSLSLMIPSSARRFNLRVIDLHGTEILNVNDKIALLNFFANVRTELSNDSLIVSFTVLNRKYIQGNVNVYFSDMNQNRRLKAGVYEDTVFFPVAQITTGKYEIKFVLTENLQSIETMFVPVTIDRPFYLDEAAWQLRVNQLEYIATPSELAELRKAASGERDSLWRAFWHQYDPTPNTPHNEREVEYFERIEYAQTHFSFGDKGWRSDRGRIYIKFGPPDEIQSRPYELSTKPYEIWLYYRLNLKFIFYDRHGFGEYILVNPQGERI